MQHWNLSLGVYGKFCYNLLRIMLKIISLKGDSDLYSVGRIEKSRYAKQVNDKALEASSFLNLELDEAKTYAENISIFGDRNAYLLAIRIGNRGVVNEEDSVFLNKELFESLQASEHFFLLHGYGAEFEKVCGEVIKDFKGVQLIKIEEKKVNDFPAEMVGALQRHDKKNSWNLLYKELSAKDAEPIHGTCVFAYKSLLVYLNDPKKNSASSGVKDFSWKQAATQAKIGKRERGEVADKYFKLILAYHKARSGRGNMPQQLESWVLEN